MPLCYLAHGLGQLKPKIENTGGKAMGRLWLHLGRTTIAAAATRRGYALLFLAGTRLLKLMDIM
jgi:hypothetical protein